MDFLNRTAELARLSALARRRDGGLAVVWGRRRIGKTRLLVEWATREKGVYFVADESTPAFQRKRLADALDGSLPGFGSVAYPDWSVLFDRLAADARRAKFHGPIVIDELPYLVANAPELPSILQRFVDHDAKDARLVLALAGSSQRMMQGLVLGQNAPLFGRAREAFEVGPLGPGYLGAALGDRDPLQIVRAFAVWGGVPRYWELAADYDDLRSAVDALVLDPRGVLHDEPVRLLLEELPPAVASRPILDAIGSGAHRLSEVASRIGVPATSLGRPLSRLLEMGLVIRDVPFGEPERTTKRALYRLGDPFLRVWFALVAPRRGWLAQSTRRDRLALFDQRMPHMLGTTWEEMSRAAIPRLGNLLGERFGPARRYWRGSGPEWDAVAESSDGKTALVAEAKWTIDGAGAAAAALLARGAPEPVAGKTLVHAVFVPRRSRNARPGVIEVDARAVLDALTND